MKACRSDMTIRRAAAVAATSLLLVLFPAGASSQVSGGPQLTFGSDSGLGIGGRLAFPLRADYDWLDGTIDANYASPEDADSWIETNANVRIRFPFAEDFETMIGAGANVTFVSVDTPGQPGSSTETSVGVNVLGGIEYPREGALGGRAHPFAEVRAILGGVEQVVFSVGLRFGASRSEPED